jgi:DNA mismatch repair protein MLH1
VSGLVTNANYHVKRTVILLFINHRSVESSALKKAVELTYSTFLPKGGHPFAYINLEIEPNRVDVNVHPTKREVNFLNEDEIIESICSEIRSQLAQVDASRTFMTQTLLPGLPPQPQHTETPHTPVRKVGISPSQKTYENSLVRTDSRMRKITSMLPSVTPSRQPSGRDEPVAGELDSGEQQDDNDNDDDGLHYETTDREALRIGLTSVKRLRAGVRSEMHNGLTELFSSHSYVGLVDERRRIVALQSGVKLYLVDYGTVLNEFFYQIGLTDFGNFGVIKLDPPPKLVELMRLGAEIERENAPLSTEEKGKEAEEIFSKAPELVSQTLIERRDMLNEYFSIQVTEDGNLLTIPLLLKGYVPSLAKLPRFLLRLGPYVDWTSEEGCFHTFLRELAAFYTPEQLPTPPSSTDSAAAAMAEDESISNRRSQLVQMLEHVLFPGIRSRLVATSALLDAVVEVADLKGLYRVFERC